MEGSSELRLAWLAVAWSLGRPKSGLEDPKPLATGPRQVDARRGTQCRTRSRSSSTGRDGWKSGFGAEDRGQQP
jgi:hypothetical protein